MKIKAIPTMYSGVHFRSRLEARWAAYFDLVKITWDYEPFDFPGWIPDFLAQGGVLEYPTLLEVKPRYTDWYEEMCTMVKAVEASGWHQTSFDMFNSIVEKGHDVLCLALGHSPLETFAFTTPDEAAWKEAGNIVQWRSPRRRAVKRR